MMPRRQLIFTTGSILIGLTASLSLAQDKKTEDVPAPESAIRQLIDQLGDASFEVRVEATRRICKMGLVASEHLKQAVATGQAEVSLRAKHLLETLDALMFSGVEVTLAVSDSTVRWHESVDITMTFTNRATVPARVPFELGAQSFAKSLEGRQVGDMLDAAEYLRITAPDGSEVNIILDDISEHPDVTNVVEHRVQGGAVSTLAPGEKVALTLRGFNREWARYPLYEKGTYRIVFDYTPQWSDDSLLAEKVGRVVSNEVQVNISEAAPSSVSRHQIMGAFTVSLENEQVVARAHCKSDKPIFINQNFGTRLPLSQARWEFSTTTKAIEIPVSPTFDTFDPNLVKKVGVGESIVIAKISRQSLQDWLVQRNASLDEPGAKVCFTYANWCNRSWQLREQVRSNKDGAKPPIANVALPRRILSARHASKSIALTEAN